MPPKEDTPKKIKKGEKPKGEKSKGTVREAEETLEQPAKKARSKRPPPSEPPPLTRSRSLPRGPQQQELEAAARPLPEESSTSDSETDTSFVSSSSVTVIEETSSSTRDTTTPETSPSRRPRTSTPTSSTLTTSRSESDISTLYRSDSRTFSHSPNSRRTSSSSTSSEEDDTMPGTPPPGTSGGSTGGTARNTGGGGTPTGGAPAAQLNLADLTNAMRLAFRQSLDDQPPQPNNDRTREINRRNAYLGWTRVKLKTLLTFCDTAVAFVTAQVDPLTNPVDRDNVDNMIERGMQLKKEYDEAWKKTQTAAETVLAMCTAQSDDANEDWLRAESELYERNSLTFKTLISRLQKLSPVRQDPTKLSEIKNRFKISEHVEKFSGKEDYIPWRESWTRAEVMMRDIFSPGERLAKLRMRLEGEPKHIIACLSDADVNYAEAVRMLDAKYNKITKELSRIMRKTLIHAPMMGCSRSRQAVLDDHLIVIHRLDGLNLSWETKYNILMQERMEKDLDPQLREKWYTYQEEKADQENSAI